MDIKASLRISCIISLIATASVILAYKCINHYCQELLKTVNCKCRKIYFFSDTSFGNNFFFHKTTKKEKNNKVK